jgi:hypothetical protein
MVGESLIRSQPDRLEPLAIALKCFYILLVTVTQTRVKGSSTMAQTRRNEPYWRLNVLVRRGFRPAMGVVKLPDRVQC